MDVKGRSGRQRSGHGVDENTYVDMHTGRAILGVSELRSSGDCECASFGDSVAR